MGQHKTTMVTDVHHCLFPFSLSSHLYLSLFMSVPLSFHVCLSLFLLCLSLSLLNALLLCVVVCCCGLAVRAVVVVAVDVAVCVRFFLSGTEKRSRVYVQNAPVCTFKTPASQWARSF